MAATDSDYVRISQGSESQSRPTLPELWRRGEATLGGFCAIPSSISAELMGRAGYGWVCLDCQHGWIGYQAMVAMLQALSITGARSLVRVSSNSQSEIGRALDAGAEGVIVPMIRSADDAARAVAACRYATAGERSWGPTRVAWGLSGYTPEDANQRTVCIPMIETKEATASLDEILSVPGVDAVYVGPNDLAVCHGLAAGGDGRDPEHLRLITQIKDACRRHEVVAGIHAGSVEAAIRWWEAGFRMINVAGDAAFLRQAVANVVARFGERPTPNP